MGGIATSLPRLLACMRGPTGLRALSLQRLHRICSLPSRGGGLRLGLGTFFFIFNVPNIYDHGSSRFAMRSLPFRFGVMDRQTAHGYFYTRCFIITRPPGLLS